MSNISFHPKTYGMNISLSKDARTAMRNTSFDNGILFTNRTINMGEHVYMNITDVDPDGQWLGSLTIGFTQIDPNSIQRSDLCKSAIPSVCKQTGVSYVKRITERLTKGTIISFYFTQDCVFYYLDGKEQLIAKDIDTRRPLWGIVDLYGNAKGTALVEPPAIIDNSRKLFNKYNQSPDNLPLRYFTRLKTDELCPVVFHDAHGPELELFCQNKVVFRKTVSRLARPYVFIDHPMKPDDEFYIRILSVDFGYRTVCTMGFTNASPTTFQNKIDQLPMDDLSALYDRPEFWILIDDAFDEKLCELDEYRFMFKKNGEIHMCRNGARTEQSKRIACADANISYYPFFFLNGRIVAFSLLGPVPVSSVPKPPVPTDDGSCQICYENPANCVMLQCGHIFFCSVCRPKFENNSTGCPICRRPIESILEIAE